MFSGSTLAHAFLPGQTEGAGDVHFDEDENWTVSKLENPKGSVNMLAIAVHEFGHAIGLEHSRIPESVMSAYYRDRDVKLHRSDIENVQRLYGEYIRLFHLNGEIDSLRQSCRNIA